MCTSLSRSLEYWDFKHHPSVGWDLARASRLSKLQQFLGATNIWMFKVESTGITSRTSFNSSAAYGIFFHSCVKNHSTGPWCPMAWLSTSHALRCQKPELLPSSCMDLGNGKITTQRSGVHGFNWKPVTEHTNWDMNAEFQQGMTDLQQQGAPEHRALLSSSAGYAHKTAPKRHWNGAGES